MPQEPKKKVTNLNTDLASELAEEAAERRKKKLAAKQKNAVMSADSLSRGGDTLSKKP